MYEENARLMQLVGKGGMEGAESEQLLAFNNREIEAVNTSWEQRLRVCRSDVGQHSDAIRKRSSAGSRRHESEGRHHN